MKLKFETINWIVCGIILTASPIIMILYGKQTAGLTMFLTGFVSFIVGNISCRLKKK